MREAIARARCVTAEAEIALVCRDLGWPLKPLDNAYQALHRHEDHANAAHARYLKARYLLLIGRLDEAESLIAAFDPAPLPPASRAAYELVNAGIAMRRMRVKASRAAPERASAIAHRTGIASLATEVESATQMLDVPCRQIGRDLLDVSGSLELAIDEQGQPNRRLLWVGPLDPMPTMRRQQQCVTRSQGDLAGLLGDPDPGSACQQRHPLGFRLVVPEPLG